MTNLSVVIPFHSSRIDNLLQTVRLLPQAYSELVLICNDVCDESIKEKLIAPIVPAGAKITLQSLGMADFSKSILCNVGIKAATNEWVCLLDSDRIVPAGMFNITPELGKCYTVKDMLTALVTVTDDQIREAQKNGVKGKSNVFMHEVRSAEYRPRGKLLFSGLTIVSKTDWAKIGGMDETFIGYGFADADLSYRACLAGIEVVFVDGVEVHLQHPRRAMKDGEMTLREGSITCNCMQFHLKHKNQPEDFVIAMTQKYVADNPTNKRAKDLLDQLGWGAKSSASAATTTPATPATLAPAAKVTTLSKPKPVRRCGCGR